MKTKVISIINYKGGVGKSLVTYNLGACLTKLYKNVLLIDFDGQGNLSTFTRTENGMKERNIVTMLESVLAGDKDSFPYNDPIENVFNSPPSLDIITCNIRKESFFIRALSEISRETILKRYIDKLKENYSYDYILIDNAPSVGLDFQNSLTASDEYIIVTEPEIGSVEGIYLIDNLIGQVKSCLNPSLKQCGIVINKVENKTNLHKEIKSMIENLNDEDTYIFKTYIPKSIIAGESEYEGKPIGIHSPNSKIAVAFDNLAKEFLKRELQ